MTRPRLPLTAALVISLAFHLVLLWPPFFRSRPIVAPTGGTLTVQRLPSEPLRLKPVHHKTGKHRKATTPDTIPPSLPGVSRQVTSATAPPRAHHWREAVEEAIKAQSSAGLLYSREAIDARLEGSALVRILLDEKGNVTATRLEESSGHPLLDRDAVAAAWRLQGLPNDTPRQIVQRIMFRLKHD